MTTRDSQNNSEHKAQLIVRSALKTDSVPLGFFFDTVLRNDYFLKRGQLEDMLAGKNHRIWVAELGGVLVGVAIQTAKCRLVNVLVHPAYRGLKIGREMVKQSGSTEVRAKLDMSTGDPRGFYETLGFQPTGERNAKGNIEIMKMPTDTPQGRAKAS